MGNPLPGIATQARGQTQGRLSEGLQQGMDFHDNPFVPGEQEFGYWRPDLEVKNLRKEVATKSEG